MTDGTPASLRLYAAAAAMFAPLAPALLRARAVRGREDRTRLGERLGQTGVERPDGPLAWLHAVSVGESLSLLPLIERLRRERPSLTLLTTTGTRAAAEIIAPRLPPGVIHQFAAIDTPAAVRGFLDHWRPRAGVFVESELWPNLILAARRREVRLALVSARMSARSFEGWRRVGSAARCVLGAFELILARDRDAAGRLEALGAEVQGVVDLKFGAMALPAASEALAAMRSALAGRVVILAASTHPGEEILLLERFAGLQWGGPRAPILIIAPRHVDRGAEVESLARRRGLATARRSAGDDPSTAEVYVADTFGEMGLWYRLADLAILGGSLVGGIGGHNPLEAARLRCPFITGTHVEAWPVYQELVAAGATARVETPARLDAWLQAASCDPAALMAQARRAEDFVAARDEAAREALGRIVAMLDP